ncbi:hypothetical protein HJD18_14540 [Thermoleophilia bacterium SCSIO 60948]|nr:hypothetical protein HJD18_14540 [Thermoleophilia bacterium SCSIO 60948]
MRNLRVRIADRRPGAGRATLAAIVTVISLGAPATASAQTPGEPSSPIPSVGDELFAPFEGSPAAADPLRAPRTPRHPFMAPNGLSNIHVDAYQTDTNTWAGPLGRSDADSAYFNRECASITFDSRGRLVTICVGLDRPVLAMLDPETLDTLAAYELPPRTPGAGSNPFTDFSGGGYFYLDRRDRAIAPTTERHILVIGQTGGAQNPGFELKRDLDVSGSLAADDKIISALPDWRGRIWFATTQGVVGWVERRSGEVHKKELGEPIGNSFAVDEKGAVYIVTDAALYRFRAKRGRVATQWRKRYANTGETPPGQTQAGSGTTPTVMAGGRAVAITDNADPQNIVVVRSAAKPRGRRVICREPVFREGSSATDQSLIGAGRSLIAENNFGYSISATQFGGSTARGLQRVDVNRRLTGCRTIWRSRERAPSAVPKLSLKSGLVYTYTKPERSDGTDPWYLTALDFDTGRTRWKRLAGTGLGFNNNYAPITIARGGTIYLGVLGGVTRFEPR